jgi:type II secretory pathway pseudopilin PulG
VISAPPPAGPARRRAAFTLVEILLVIAVLTVMAGVVWPGVWRFVGEMRLREGADNARLNLAATRMRAMEGGEAYRWFCQPGGRWYAALAQNAETQGSAASNTTGSNHTAGAATKPAWRWLAELPEGVVFDAATLAGVPPQTVPTTLLAGMTGAERIDDAVTWVEVARFQADGSSRGARLVVADAEGRTVAIDIRPLTGAATLGQVEVRRGP